MRIGVVIRTTNGLWSMTRFQDESAISYFIHEAKKVISNLKDINLVSLSYDCIQMAPPEFEPKRTEKLYWCPYCGEPRHFHPSHVFTGYFQCEICGISDADYYIKCCNHLFPKADLKKIKARKEIKKEEQD